MKNNLAILENIIEKGVFPTSLDNKTGEQLKEIFSSLDITENNIKEIKRKYFFYHNNYHYTLLEEFLFDEEDNSFDYRKLIGTQYYLNRKKTE